MIKYIFYSPTIIFFLIWFTALLLGFVAITAPSADVVTLCIFFVIFMGAGEILSKILPVLNIKKKVVDYRLALYMSLFLLIITIIYVINILQVYLQFDSFFEAPLGIRRLILSGEKIMLAYNFYIFSLQMLFAVSYLGLLIINSTSHKMKQYKNFFIFCMLFSVIASLLDGSRSFMIASVICCLSYLSITGRFDFIKLCFALSVLSIFIITSFSIFRPIDNGIYEGMLYFIVYVSGGVLALDSALSGRVAVYWQDLEYLINNLHGLGLASNYYDVSLLQNEFVEIGPHYMTNVYTSLGVYYNYIGWCMMCLALAIGLLGGYLSRVSKYSVLSLWFYTFFLMATILSIFHDYYLSYGYFLVKVFIILFVVSFISALLKLSFRGR
jgi:oligosaccharide repeat unit polymerase